MAISVYEKLCNAYCELFDIAEKRNHPSLFFIANAIFSFLKENAQGNIILSHKEQAERELKNFLALKNLEDFFNDLVFLRAFLKFLDIYSRVLEQPYPLTERTKPLEKFRIYRINEILLKIATHTKHQTIKPEDPFYKERTKLNVTIDKIKYRLHEDELAIQRFSKSKNQEALQNVTAYRSKHNRILFDTASKRQKLFIQDTQRYLREEHERAFPLCIDEETIRLKTITDDYFNAIGLRDNLDRKKHIDSKFYSVKYLELASLKQKVRDARNSQQVKDLLTIIQDKASEHRFLSEVTFFGKRSSPESQQIFEDHFISLVPLKK